MYRGLLSLVVVTCALAALVPAGQATEGGDRLKIIPTIKLRDLGSFETGVFDESAAEIVAFDARSRRLFVVNGNDAAIDIIDIRRKTRPRKVGQIDVTPFGAGPNSVAVSDGLVAVAVEADTATDPGSVVFFDTHGSFLAQVAVGALPDALTFSPDGKLVVVANEGEPDDGIDPEGSVSVIDLGAGVLSASVATADFNAFDDRAAFLRNRGVRLFPEVFAGGITVSQDLEPEFITIAPDGQTAYASLQEANAVAIVDLSDPAAPEVSDIVALGLKDHLLGQPEMKTFAFEERPALGQVPNLGGVAQDILLGGFSGLYFEGRDGDRLVFVTHPDRGPNSEPTDLLPDVAGNERPFPLPDFQPEVLRFALDPQSGEIEILERIGLTRADGTPLTGRPNLQAGAARTAYTDELPVDLTGNLLDNDPLGADLEGIVIDPRDGSYWLSDEYRPAVYHFDSGGRLIDRFVPEGTAASVGAPAETFGRELFPAVYAQRRANRGFEALALDLDALKLYAFIQSPIDNPDTANDTNSRAGSVLRILELDVADAANPAVSGEFAYVLDGARSVDKIGDAVWHDGRRFLVIERDSAVGPEAQKFVFEIDLTGATNLLTDPISPLPGKTLEQHLPDELVLAGITPVQKRKVLNLPSIGYTAGDKPEGLALIPEDEGLSLAVINDNDFGLLDEEIPGDGRQPFNPEPTPVVLGLIHFDGANGLDASDRDDEINIQPWPVLGMFMPDSIASFEADGQTYVVTANEGDDRGEDERIEDLALDPDAFPDAAELQAEGALGRLGASTIDGDLDGDGDFDRLQAYGARSFTIWDARGNQVFDSGQLFEQVTAAEIPDFFNSDNDENTFDTRSDAKGPEPEALALGEYRGRRYAFVGLERVGGIMILDITDPAKPLFIDYETNRDFLGDPEAGTAGDLGPEGIVFIPRDFRKLIFRPLLVVANEVSGTTTIYEVRSGRPIVLLDGRRFDDRLGLR